MIVPKWLTADDLTRVQAQDKHTELVRGVMVVSEPPGFRHGDIAVKLTVILAQFVRSRGLGTVLSESGYVLARNPDTVRGPDVSFVRKERVPDQLPQGFAHFAPDLAVEVLSPDDRPGEILEKVADYLRAGTPLVWVIDPDLRQVRVHRSDHTMEIIGETGFLDGESVLPGFTCALAEIL